MLSWPAISMQHLQDPKVVNRPSSKRVGIEYALTLRMFIIDLIIIDIIIFMTRFFRWLIYAMV